MIQGPFIATADGVVYVGGNGRTLYRQIPVSRPMPVNVVTRKRKPERTILEIIGLK